MLVNPGLVNKRLFDAHFTVLLVLFPIKIMQIKLPTYLYCYVKQ